MLAAIALVALAQLTSPPLITPETPEGPLELRQEPVQDQVTGPSVRDARTRLAVLRSEPAPSIAGPIGVLAGGIGLIGTSVIFAYAGLGLLGVSISSVLATAAAFLIIAGIAAIPALIMTIAGARWLIMELKARRERSREIRDLEERIRKAPIDHVMPLGPVPSVSAPQPSLLLATF